MIRRLLVLAALAGAAWWFLSRRDATCRPGTTVGYEDGSSVTLGQGSPEHERLSRIARGIVGA